MLVQKSGNVYPLFFVRDSPSSLDQLLCVLSALNLFVWGFFSLYVFFYSVPLDNVNLEPFCPGRHTASGHWKINELSVTDFP